MDLWCLYSLGVCSQLEHIVFGNQLLKSGQTSGADSNGAFHESPVYVFGYNHYHIISSGYSVSDMHEPTDSVAVWCEADCDRTSLDYEPCQ